MSTTNMVPATPQAFSATRKASVKAHLAESVGEARRRRSFAVISHPDAGKSTLTEALALHARVMQRAGAVHAKDGRKGTVSDWMDIERERGISITSAALQFTYRDTVINLVDTPGHADFSEDTYRLFEVCKHRNIPIITVINKWDRAGKDVLDLMDEIHDRTGLQPAPLNWPVGIAGDFRGVLDMATGDYLKFTRTDGGATVATEEHLSAVAAEALEGEVWRQAVEESDLIVATGAGVDPEGFLAATSTPVMFGSAVLNFGVRFLLDTLVDLAPAPTARPDADGVLREIDSPFSAFVFKVQAGMDVAHRDRLAFVRICSGTFERGMIVTHSGTNRPFATKYAQQVMGRERTSIDRAFPGDVVGLVNANALRVGDTLYVDEPVTFPPIPSFSPEHFAVARAKDTSRYKQFRRGIEQLDHEGVVQVLRSDLRGDQAPVLAAVGPMQFEVAEHRMAHEFNSPVSLDRLGYSLARRTDPEGRDRLRGQRAVEVLSRSDGVLLAVFSDRWRLQSVERELDDILLAPLVVSV
jgi:peptide chain release factor 3